MRSPLGRCLGYPWAVLGKMGRSWEDHGKIMGIFLGDVPTKWKPGIDLVFQILKFLCQPSVRDDLDDLDDLNPLPQKDQAGEAPPSSNRERDATGRER